MCAVVTTNFHFGRNACIAFLHVLATCFKILDKCDWIDSCLIITCTAWNAQISQIHSIAVAWPLNGLFTLHLKLILFSIYRNNIIQFELHVLTFALSIMFVDIYSMARHGSQVMRLSHAVSYPYIPYLINFMVLTQLCQLWLFWEIFLTHFFYNFPIVILQRFTHYSFCPFTLMGLLMI